jgi:hypothetical protein
VRELSLPVSGPTVVVVFELEGPVRLLLAGADHEDDTLRVGEWIGSSALRSKPILAALAAVDANSLNR